MVLLLSRTMAGQCYIILLAFQTGESMSALRDSDMWQKHHRLVYWWAIKLARKFDMQASDFIGWLTIRFARMVALYKPERGSWSTLFSLHIVSDAVRDIVCKDSETQSLRHYNATHRNKSQIRLMAYDFGTLAEKVPVYTGTDDWTADILDMFDGPDAMWRYLTRDLSDVQRVVVVSRFRDGDTYKAIAKRLGFTKQRAAQVYNRSMDKLRERVAKLGDWNALWKNS